MSPTSPQRVDRPAYDRLTPTFMVELAAPHTWPAAIFPVFVACALAVANGGYKDTGSVNGLMVLVLLAICILLQSAVNTINDYFDFVKGTDSVDNQPDPTDAVLVYHHVNPKSVRTYFISLIAVAFALGVYVIARTGWVPLAIALVGVVVIFLYSGGKTPISYLPLGEAVSGFVMGGLIPLACYQALTGSFSWMVLLWSVPLILGIALIMLTNNGCDIDKDVLAHRKTLPVLLGHDHTRTLYHAIIYLWIGAICLLVLVFFFDGWIALPFMLLAAHPFGRKLLANPLTPQSRAGAFALCATMNITLGAFYGAAIITSIVPTVFVI